MEENRTFKTAVSLRGHDTGRRYVVVGEVNKDFVLVADGKYRKLDNPKVKRVKHVRVDGMAENLSAERLTDESVKRALKIVK